MFLWEDIFFFTILDFQGFLVHNISISFKISADLYNSGLFNILLWYIYHFISAFILPRRRGFRPGRVRRSLCVSVPAARWRVPPAAGALRLVDRGAQRGCGWQLTQARVDVSLSVRGARPADRRREEPKRGGWRAWVGQGHIQPGRTGRLHPGGRVHGRRRARF